jgi:drug/metabolite transporter (DMT)-like permease
MTHSHSAPESRGQWFAKAAPGIFVFLWSTGFIGAKYGLPSIEPFTFLAVRFSIVIVICFLLCTLLRASWPRNPREIAHIAISGLLIHAVYLGGVFSAIALGMPSGMTSLVVGLQPIVAALLSQPFLGEKVVGRQWIGFILGFIGVALVVGEKITAPEQGLSAAALAAAIIALFGTSFGNLYQRRFCSTMQLVPGTTIQYIAAGLAMWIFALLFETRQITWTNELIFAMLWLVIALSIGAILLLMWLISRNSAARVSSLYYLVPPATALEAFILFNERLSPLALLGMLITIIAVALVVMPQGRRLKG